MDASSLVVGRGAGAAGQILELGGVKLVMTPPTGILLWVVPFMVRSNGAVPVGAGVAFKIKLKALASQVADALIVAVGGVQPTPLILITPFVVVLSTDAAAKATSVGGLLKASVVDPLPGTAITLKVIERIGPLAVRYGADKSTPTKFIRPVVLLNVGPTNEVSSPDILVTAVA